ncbi:MAG: patatin-like phospholipase family protein, partial [Sphingomonadaceae bacterium]
MRFILILFVLLGASACQHSSPANSSGLAGTCEINRYSLTRPLPDQMPSAQTPETGDEKGNETGNETGLPDFGREIASVNEHQYGPLLFLSGGSQNGAFGAGFLDGWNIARGLPEFSIVTGVSTGGLQATGAFIRNTQLTVDGYKIDSEKDILKTYVSGVDVHGKNGKGGNVSTRAIAVALQKGAFADLVPLRKKLDDLLTPEVLDEVGEGYIAGRRLYVAATDVDLGSAVAFDLSELANRYRQIRSQPEKTAADEKRMKKLKSCYIDALLASAIVPPGARPV